MVGTTSSCRRVNHGRAPSRSGSVRASNTARGGSRLISRPLADFTHVNESTDVSDGLPAQPAIRGTYLQSGANLSGDHSHVQDCSV